MSASRDNLLPSGEKVAPEGPDEGPRRPVRPEREAPRTHQARRLRKTATYAENRLWEIVRGKRLEGFKFRRQAPIGPYIVDFACLKRRLVVELDGGVHGAPFVDPMRDRLRDAWLAKEGYRVLRFTNSQLEDRLHRVLELILAALRPSGTTPSSVGYADTFSPGGEKET